MQYRRLGRSGLQVSLLSFGSWLTFGKQIGDEVAEALMKQAYDAGVNFFDNAEIYAQGESERVMGRILKKMAWRRSSYLVSSKVFFGHGGHRSPNETGLSRKHIIEGCHAALERFGLDYLDLYFCHRADKNTPIEETVRAMNTLIEQGKILYWGTSEWSAQEIAEAYAVADRLNLIGPTMEQPQYNMFHRERFELEYARLYEDRGLGTTIWSPLASGVLTGKYSSASELPEGTRLSIAGMDWLREQVLNQERLDKAAALGQLAQEAGMSLSQLALAWCAKNPNVSTVILGASKPHHLEENLKTLVHLPKLDADFMEKIEAILGNKPHKGMF